MSYIYMWIVRLFQFRHRSSKSHTTFVHLSPPQRVSVYACGYAFNDLNLKSFSAATQYRWNVLFATGFSQKWRCCIQDKLKTDTNKEYILFFMFSFYNASLVYFPFSKIQSDFLWKINRPQGCYSHHSFLLCTPLTSSTKQLWLCSRWVHQKGADGPLFSLKGKR